MMTSSRQFKNPGRYRSLAGVLPAKASGLFLLLILLSLSVPDAKAVVSSNNANASFNWTNAASWSNSTMPGTTNAGVTNNTDTAIFTTLTNQIDGTREVGPHES